MTVGAVTQGRFGHVSQDAEDPRDKPVRSRRVAVIDERGALRREMARAVTMNPQLELVLSSQCLRDAFALSIPPDLIVLGSWRCDVTDATDVPEQVESLACPVLTVDGTCGADPMPAGCLSSIEDRSMDEDVTVVSAIHATPQSLALAGSAQDSPEGDFLPTGVRRAPLTPTPSLSHQERRALALYSSGMTLDAVAEAMFVTPNTVATYLKRVRSKLRAAGGEVDSKMELRDCALAHGVIDLPSPPLR